MHFIFFTVLFVFLATSPVQAQIRINEIYPVPASGAYEWVELFNASTQSQALSQYRLKDLANHPITLPAVNIASQSYIVATTSGILNNSGDTLILTYADGTVLDQMTYQDTLTSTQSLSFCGEEWIISELISPGFSNAACAADTPTPVPTHVYDEPIYSTVSPTSTPQPTYVQQTQQPITYSNMHFVTVYPTPLPTFQSFTKKFARPDVSSSPVTPTTTSKPPIELPRSCKNTTPTMMFLFVLALSGISGIAGFTLYSLVKKMKDTYNETYADT